MLLADRATDFFLEFTNWPIIITMLMVGFLWINRAIFFHAACILSVDLVTNVALKGMFRIPPLSEVPEGVYVFPSGHMQGATVFYIWLAINLPSRIWMTVAPILLIGIGAALIHHKCHNLRDVIGGISFGLLLISFYKYTWSHHPKQLSRLLLLITTPLMAYNLLAYSTIPSHAWFAYTALIGLLIIERLPLRLTKQMS